MPRKPSSRKFQLTINNPIEHGYTHDRIKAYLSEFTGLRYWCMCDEIGEQGTPHTHVFVVFNSSVMFDTLHKRFYGVHIEQANGKNSENRDYVRKEGKWLEDAKHETNLIDTFEEWGDLPPDRSRQETQSEKIMQMVIAGKSNAEILAELPTAYNKLQHIEQARQTLLQDQFKNAWRKLNVTYLWGDTGAGKTRSVMEAYGYSNVYQVTNYDHPFDAYKGQDVIIFEEFRSSLGLKWNCIDFDRKTMTIRHTVCKVTEVVAKDKTKTASSHRTFPLMDEAVKIFREAKSQEEQNRIAFGREYQENEYVFKWPDGHTYSPDYLTHRFADVLKQHGLPHIRFHDLRHSCASMLIAMNWSLKDVQEWLGHSDIQMTANIYSHLDTARKANIAASLAEKFGG